MDRYTKLSNIDQTIGGIGSSSSLSLRQYQQQSASSNNGRVIANQNNYNGRQRFNKIRNKEFKLQSSSTNRHGNYTESANEINYTFKRSNNGTGNVNYQKNNFKERFVQANCQFIISFYNENNEKLISENDNCLNNPDASIEWASIEEVIFTAKMDDNVHCPICLHYPVAAKITRCGHIYCWSCMLHYLSLSDKKYRPCPICFNKVRNEDLKSVTILMKRNFLLNDIIEFKLMKIHKKSKFPLPIDDNDNDERFLSSIKLKHQNENADKFHRIFLSSYEQKFQLIEREFDELQKEFDEYKQNDMAEICFVENALEQLAIRRSLLDKQMDLNQTLDLALLQSKSDYSNDNNNSNDYHYFYQSSDGQHIYPHSINIRMLKQEYKDFPNCPSVISGKVIDIHRQTITDDIRKRFAHLRHLPLSCEFIIAELQFNFDDDDKYKIISDETMEKFRNEIKNRQRERRRKEKRQNIRDRHIDLENDRKYYNRVHFQLENPDFSLTDADFQPLVDVDDGHISSSSDTPIQSTAASPSSSIQSSFANMLMTSNSNGKNIKFNDRKIQQQKSKPIIQNDNDDDDDNEQTLTMMDALQLSDYFDQCVRNAGNNDNAEMNDENFLIKKTHKKKKNRKNHN